MVVSVVIRSKHVAQRKNGMIVVLVYVLHVPNDTVVLLGPRPTGNLIVATSDTKMCCHYEKQRRIPYAPTSVASGGGERTTLLAFCKVRGVGRDGMLQAR